MNCCPKCGAWVEENHHQCKRPKELEKIVERWVTDAVDEILGDHAKRIKNTLYMRDYRKRKKDGLV